ncbi:hypothetical protein PIB30_087678, partial [Stylosanthes scabra]|nr:hypothetical protein [Stylosanthes scabra]
MDVEHKRKARLLDSYDHIRAQKVGYFFPTKQEKEASPRLQLQKKKHTDSQVHVHDQSKVPQLPTLSVLRKFSLCVFTAGVNSATHLKTLFSIIFSQNRRRRRARKDPKPWDTKFRSERRFVELETRSPEKLAGKRTSCRSSKVEDDHVSATSSPRQRHVIATSAARHRHMPL